MKHILFLSGAGLSAPSGIKTFRDANGLWEEHSVMEVCSVEGFAKNRKKVMDFYDRLRTNLKDKKPNAAHFMQAKLKSKYPKQVHILTQNVDDLLEKANCDEVVHLHGTLRHLRCQKCKKIFDIGYEGYEKKTCPFCHEKHIRHNVVMFGEMAPEYETLQKKLKIADMLVCVGTSGEVLDVAYFASMCKHSMLNNLDFDERLDKAFDIKIYESAEIAASKIEKICEDFLV